jgi:diguanylate cyclase
VGWWWRRWWRQSDHFEWLSEYLRARGLAEVARRCMAAVSGSLVFVPFEFFFNDSVRYPLFADALAVIASVGAVSFALLWLTRWPTRSQSLGFALTGNVVVAGCCLVQPDPLVGLMGATGLAVIGGYFAFFHSPKFTTYNFTVASFVGAICAAHLVAAGQYRTAASGYWLVLELNIAVPFAIQMVVNLMGTDLRKSLRDPLTGLLTRSAFYDRVSALASDPKRGGDHLAVIVIDLDDFKHVNDTYGHAAGDRVLADVGRTLIAHTRDGAAICRLGGEEFVIADVIEKPDPGHLAQRLCDAIAALPQQITASIGTATCELADVAPSRADVCIDDLVASADTAMYIAKRHGGNQTRHHASSDRRHPRDLDPESPT